MKFFENIGKKQLFSLNYRKLSGNSKNDSKDFNGFIEGVPYINAQYNYSNAMLMTTQPENYRNIIDNYLKACPEALDMIEYVTTDIVSDGFSFIPVKESGKSSNKVKAAEKWAEENNFLQGVIEGLFDYLALGNVAWWYKIDGNSSTQNIGKLIMDYNRYQKEDKKIKIKDYIKLSSEVVNIDDDFEVNIKEFKDEDFNKLVKFRHVAWSSISILSNPLEIIGFMQSAGSSGPIADYNTGQPIPGKTNYAGMVRRIWPPSQIIHGKYMGWDGKEYGFSPMIASLPVISIIISLRAYAGRYFEDCGSMEKMFMFKGMSPNDPSIKKFNQMLQTYKKNYKKRGYYTGTTGPDGMDVIDVNKWDKDMEFMNLYVSSVATLAANFQMPSARVQSILGLVESVRPSDTADPAYWRYIKQRQNAIENLLNSQLFIPHFGVKVKFNNSYLQDDIRKAQLDTQNVAAVMGIQKILREDGKELTTNKVKQMFLINDDDLQEFSEEKRSKLQEIENPQFALPGNQDKQNNQQLRGEKRNEQNKRQESRQLKNEGT